MNPNRTLPIPPHFDPAKVGQVWRVPYQQLAQDAQTWAKTHHIQPAIADSPKICLLAIDIQNTFCIPDFELFVGGRSGNGAVEDNQRLCEFIYRNLHRITAVIPTMDTHTTGQIFHPVFWVNSKGENPPPLTQISLRDVENGVWKVNPAIAQSLGDRNPEQIQQYAHHYVKQLEIEGKYPLIIWPYHSLLGGIGHALVSAVEEAIFFHNLARHAPTGFELKGNHPLTENYSVLRPEVLLDQTGKAIAHQNSLLMEKLLEFEVVMIAGQAKSHCVAWTIDDLLQDIQQRDPKLAQKVYLLEDCTSPVVVPNVVDFTDAADAAFARFSEAGMHLVQSTEAMDNWPGLAGSDSGFCVE
ncbi:isochorismatase [Laspinema sp. A4]|uniref:isochorismatase n=1 Tax=Laspinema sp. D2d TaxID=2953686 RepID=UPI0021BB3D4E|nr:isochorismatase [Laspinema sp. D2d]MCT7984645.1 isochorismatase [Laspinema sp. D2d]